LDDVVQGDSAESGKLAVSSAPGLSSRHSQAKPRAAGALARGEEWLEDLEREVEEIVLSRVPRKMNRLYTASPMSTP
jgi:hypothetical protein